MPEEQYISHLRVGDLDVQGRVLAIRRLSACLFDQIRNGANLVQHPELGGSGRGCRVDEDPLALDHDLQWWQHGRVGKDEKSTSTLWAGENDVVTVVKREKAHQPSRPDHILHMYEKRQLN